MHEKPDTSGDTPDRELCQTHAPSPTARRAASPAPSSPHRRSSGARQFIALAALMTGAVGIGSSGIFVRLSETGPTATAFWRGALALPLLALWAFIEARRDAARATSRGEPPRRRSLAKRLDFDARVLWAGVFFAGDLGLWHWSLLKTSIAASTLEANLAPIVVTLIAWIAWRERPSPRFIGALACAVAGVLLIMSPTLGIRSPLAELGAALHGAHGALPGAHGGVYVAHGTPRGTAGSAGGHGSQGALGDLLGLATACFYAGYLIVVARLRATRGAGNVMLRVTLVFTVLLLPIALTQRFLPQTPTGWAYLAGLALIAQVFGQGLIAYALAHLPATFGSVGLYVQPIAAALYAWLLLGERLSVIQLLGAAIVLAAIALARPAQGRVIRGRASPARR